MGRVSDRNRPKLRCVTVGQGMTKLAHELTDAVEISNGSITNFHGSIITARADSPYEGNTCST